MIKKLFSAWDKFFNRRAIERHEEIKKLLNSNNSLLMQFVSASEMAIRKYDEVVAQQSNLIEKVLKAQSMFHDEIKNKINGNTNNINSMLKQLKK